MSWPIFNDLGDGTILVELPGGIQVFAREIENFPIPGLFMTWAQGLMYLRRIERQDGSIVIRDVTLATLRYSVLRAREGKERIRDAADELRRSLVKLRVREGKDRAKDVEHERRRSLADARKSTPKIGSPTPERRRRGLEEDLQVQRVAAPLRPNAADAAVVYYVPDMMAQLHRRGAITSNMAHAASRFHHNFVTAGFVGLRAAKLTRAAQSTGGIAREPEQMLDAREKIYFVCDRMGGFQNPGFQALVNVVGEGRSLRDWADMERRQPWRLNGDSAKGVLICALGVLDGLYRRRPNR